MPLYYIAEWGESVIPYTKKFFCKKVLLSKKLPFHLSKIKSHMAGKQVELLIERCFLGTGERFEDGLYILHVNGSYCRDMLDGRLYS